jgi:hypothetical protein
MSHLQRHIAHAHESPQVDSITGVSGVQQEDIMEYQGAQPIEFVELDGNDSPRDPVFDAPMPP